MAIQVSYNPKKTTETWERESTALIKLSKVLDCKRLIILTYELEEEIVVKVKVVSFRQMYHAEVVTFRLMYHAEVVTFRLKVVTFLIRIPPWRFLYNKCYDLALSSR